MRVEVRVKDWGWEYPTPFWVRVRPVDADLKAGVRALHAEGIIPHLREESWGVYLALDTPTGLSQDALVAHLADQCWIIAAVSSRTSRRRRERVGTLSEPSVGRPVSLGHERDLADAAAILRIMRVLHERRRAGASVHKIARESVWFLWESPRLPRPLVRSKYPESYPWSPGARQALQSVLDEGQAAGRVTGLIIEHLIPMKLLLDAALAQGPQPLRRRDAGTAARARSRRRHVDH